jgi:two-component system, NtrC family, sensor histidine kinase HydH
LLKAKAMEGRRKLRWWGAVAGLALGTLDIVLAHVLHVEFLIGGRDIAFFVFVYLAGTFGVFGWMFGRLLEAIAAERHAIARVKAQAETIAEARVQIAHTEKLATLGQLASAIAHEIRNPLAIIRSTVQNLAEALPPGDQGSERSCRFVLEEIDRLTRVTSALLNLAKPLSIKRSPVRALEILARADLVGRPVIESRSLRLMTSDPDPEARVEGDRDLLCQALIGMLNNAAEVTPAGGQVTVEAQCTEGEVAFAVSDTGPGVPPENRGKIFEPFFTTRQSGHGLGLAIARQIVEAHGGKIEVGDRPGGGAKFVIRIPRYTGAIA